MARFVAPGRVNLMGDHTDYNSGFVLPLALDRACTVSASPADGPRVTARSHELPGTVDVAVDGSADPRTVEPVWGRFVAGVVHALRGAGIDVPGTDLAITSTVPPGSGLSSSSALSVALTLALTDAAGVARDRRSVARLALAAEVAATGVPGGLMDQLASLFGQADHALLVDCRTSEVTPIPISPAVAVLVVHSGVPRTLAGTAYAARRAECEAIAARLGMESLRDATATQVREDPRARHVVTENGRVLATAAALPGGDLSVLGPLLLASHASLRDDYEVSVPELDLLVELLVECGAAGARLTGAGFGGCVVALAQRNHADNIVAKAALRYRAATGIEPLAFVARAVDGARGAP
ncbi:MAG: galactokinase [Actinomycetota bacterium]|nr:galactokinase [Actinomycetota bacterium]